MSDPGADPYAQPTPASPSSPRSQPSPYPQPPPYRPGPESPWGGPPGWTGSPNPWPAPKPTPTHHGTNGFAIASLVFGLIGGIPLAFIFGVIALGQIEQRKQEGRALAVGGLVGAGLWTVGLVAAAAHGSFSEPDRDAAGQITEEGTVSTFDIEIGDCLNGLLETENESSVGSLPAVPCSQPHEGEVYASFDLAEGDYPGLDAIVVEADRRCAEALMTYSPSAYDDPTISLFYLYPHEPSWPRDRQVVCIAYDLDGAMTGSIAERTRA